MSKALSITNKNTHFESILASYLDDKMLAKLSPTQKEMKLRWETAFSLLLNFNSREKTVQILKKQFDLSLATAYRDVNQALALFGDINKSRKEGWRYIIFEYNQNLMDKAREQDDLATMGRCLDRMIKLADLDKEEASFNPEKLQAQIYEITLPKPLQNALNKMINKGVVDFNDEEIQDIPFTEVKDEN